MTYAYRADVLAALAAHGVQPTAETPPEIVRGFVNDLYRHELRALRAAMLRGDFPKREYAGRVDALRRRYPVLALRAREWVIAQTPKA